MTNPKYRIESEAPPLLGDRGFSLHSDGIEQVAKHVRTLIDELPADGLAIDCNWVEDDFYGVKLWQVLQQDGLAMDSRCVVFLSEFLTPLAMSNIVRKLGISPLQVHHKDVSGYTTAAKWLSENI